MKKFKVLSRKMIVDEPFCHIEKQKIELHDGSSTNWFLRKSPDAVVIVPTFQSGEVMLQRAYKNGSGTIVTEFPAGMVNEKETPALTAARELREETGLVAEKLHKIGTVFADPTGSPMRYHFFLAEICRPIADTEYDKAEQIETFLVPNFEAAKQFLTDTTDQKDKNTPAAASLCVIPFVETFLENQKKV
ncbi:NUDIX hydrolase [bacterium]|nr:NUDIX hydrolase [bacterium]MBT6831711.1 NUDIX hydrolase [bacterium]MBT6996534.1 NUDIX hydrolase [bacterium]MBT7772860.1 NUDIX hydrolase [bacterium]